MKAIFLFALTVLLFATTNAQQITIGSYNIRYDNPGDSGNLWVNRAPVVASLITFHNFDIFGTQEGLKNQLDYLSKALPEYARYGVGRDDGKEAGEFSAIYFKKDRFKLINKGDFWLSETPNKPSLGWDATCCKRLCSWVQLKEAATGKQFYVFNAHFDHQGVKARVESSKLILKKIKEIAGTNPVIFTGDLNGGRNSEWYQTLKGSGFMNDSFDLSEVKYANSGSFNGFRKDYESDEVIDHVFVSKPFKVLKWGILTDTYQGKYPSDHFPIMVTVKL